MPIGSGKCILMHKRLFGVMWTKNDPVRQPLIWMVGGPSWETTAGAICERSADSGSFVPPGSDAQPGLGRCDG